MTPTPLEPQPAPAPKKRRHPLLRAFRWLVLVFFILLGGAVISIYLGEWQSRNAWAAYQAEAKARGVKLELGDFLRPPIPESENFAASPLFRFPPGASELPNPFRLPLYVLQRKSAKADARSQLEVIHASLVHEGWIPKDDPAPVPAAVRAALARYDAPWAQLLEAAAKPDTQFAVPWETEGTLAQPLEHMSVLMSAARLAKIRAQIQLVENRPAEALQEWRLLWRLGQTMNCEPTVLCWLVKIVPQRDALNVLFQGLESHVWTRAELEEIARVLNGADALAEFVWSYSSERAGMNDYLVHLFERNNRKSGAGGAPKQQSFGGLISIYPSLVRLNREADHVLSEIDVPGRRFATKTPTWKPETAFFEWNDKRRYMFYRVMAPESGVFVTRALQLATRIDQARVACALERYRLENNGYPEALAALVPDFIASVPHDIFDGAPLRYKRAGDRALVYSVGPNLKDDGGDGSDADSDKALDWVWGFTRD